MKPAAKPIPHFCHVHLCMAQIEQHVFLCPHHFRRLGKADRASVTEVCAVGIPWRDRHGSDWTPVVDRAVRSLEREG